MARNKYTITDMGDDSKIEVSQKDFLRSLAFNCAVAAAYGEDPEGTIADEVFENFLNNTNVTEEVNGFLYEKSEVTKCYC